MTTETKSIDALAKAVSDATEALRDAERSESMARSRTTDARNRLNDNQKALDAALLELRKTAPRDSHWGDDRRLVVRA